MPRRRKRGKPLLYLEQPAYQDVTTSMQDKFYFNDLAEESTIKEDQSESPVATEEKQIEPMALVEEKNEEEKDNEKKTFSDMTVEEKIEYLQQFPVSVVKIQYSFVTSDNTITGYFVSKEEEAIKVIPKNKRKTIRLAIEEIEDIKIRGL